MMRWVKYAVVLVGLTTLFYYVQGYLYQRKTGPKEPKNKKIKKEKKRRETKRSYRLSGKLFDLYKWDFTQFLIT